LTVVDGCSSDNTMKIIREKLEGSGVKSVFANDGGRGLSVARQMIVDSCSSKYIVWVDGDNVLPPNFLKAQVEYLENANLKTGSCAVKPIPLGKRLVARLQGYQWIIWASNWKEDDSIMGKTAMQGTICRVDAIRDVGGFDCTIKGAGEDIELFIRMKDAGWGIGVNKQTRIYHNMRDTWSGLWKESVWQGYANHYFTAKHTHFYPSLGRRAYLEILGCVKLTLISFKLTKDLGCILMPLLFSLWWLGSLMGHYYARRDGYEPALHSP
jgi:GT2 family glycosyltransferase